MLGIVLEIKEDGTLLAYSVCPTQIVVLRDTENGGVQAEILVADFFHNLSPSRHMMALAMVDQETEE